MLIILCNREATDVSDGSACEPVCQHVTPAFEAARFVLDCEPQLQPQLCFRRRAQQTPGMCVVQPCCCVTHPGDVSKTIKSMRQEERYIVLTSVYCSRGHGLPSFRPVRVSCPVHAAPAHVCPRFILSSCHAALVPTCSSYWLLEVRHVCCVGWL